MEDEFPLFTFSLVPVFRHLPPKMFIKVLSCCLMDGRLLVLSSDMELLGIFSESVLAAMYPFRWCHAYVPVLPQKMLYFLEAPVPFIMGVASTLPDTFDKLCEDVVVVDLDRGAIVKNEKSVSVFPELRSVARDIQQLLLTPTTNADPTKSIRTLLAEAFASLFVGYECYLLDNSGEKGKLKFDSVSFLSDLGKDTAEIMQKFLKTQSFAYWLDTRRQASKASPANPSLWSIQYFEGLVKQKEQRLQPCTTLRSSRKKRACGKPSTQSNVYPQYYSSFFGEGQADRVNDFVDINFTKILDLTCTFFLSNEKHQEHSIMSTHKEEPHGQEPSESFSGVSAEELFKFLESVIADICFSYNERLENSRRVGDATKIETDAVSSSSSLSLNPEHFGPPANSELDYVTCFQTSHEESSSLCDSPRTTSKGVLPAEEEYASFNKKVQNGIVRLCVVIEYIFNHGKIGDFDQSTFGQLLWKCSLSHATELNEDIRRIRSLHEVTSFIGRGRAFMKLSIEKGILHNHMNTLLLNIELLQGLYEPHAMILDKNLVDRLMAIISTIRLCDCSCFSEKYYARDLTSWYCLHVTTGRGLTAATTAAVFCALQGEGGKGSEVFLLKRAPKSFKRGETSQFIIHTPWLGPIKRLLIGHNNGGTFPGWFLEDAYVEHVVTGIVYYFPNKEWLADDEGDRKITRRLRSAVYEVKDNEGFVIARIPLRLTSFNLQKSGLIRRLWIPGKTDFPLRYKSPDFDLKSSVYSKLNIPYCRKTALHVCSYKRSSSAEVTLSSRDEISEQRKPSFQKALLNLRDLNVTVFQLLDLTSRSEELEWRAESLFSENLLTSLVSILYTCLSQGLISNRGIFRSKLYLWNFLCVLSPENCILNNAEIKACWEKLSILLNASSEIKSKDCCYSLFSWTIYYSIKKNWLRCWLIIITSDPKKFDYYDQSVHCLMLDKAMCNDLVNSCGKLDNRNILVPSDLIDIIKEFI
ncbi:DENN domain-containing protein 5A-like [Zophobas morio]|uniref:DENN domain-containing protein 5A-like n=1 Tax=Zophobas morio TaxID=2755281 RepID=UPI003082D491